MGIPDEEIEIPLFENGFGFAGAVEVMPAHKVRIPVPPHLRKEDAEPPQVVTGVDLEDLPMWGWDTGIKPEIHIKYRQPPLNDPNWTFVKNPKSDGTPTPAMSWKEVVSQMKPWTPDYVKEEQK